MSGKRVRRIVADNVNGQVGFIVNKAKFAQLFICVFRCNRNDLSAVPVIGTKLTVPAGMTIAAGEMVNEAKLSELKEGGNIA